MLDASELDIICQQNDPKTMSQVHQDQESIRKPDVVIIPFSYDAFPDTAKMVGSRERRLENAREQPIKALVWKDALACIEFKRPTKKTLSPPKATYRVENYVATKPEYRRVEDPVPDPPVTAETSASQTKATPPAPDGERRQLS
jgi:hypothetical protein